MFRIRGVLGKTLSVLCVFCFACSVSPLCANNIFEKYENAKNGQTDSSLKIIKSKMNSEKGSSPILDFLKKNSNEFFLRTADGLYYCSIKGSQVLIDRLFWGNLSQIEPVKLFSIGEKQFLILRNTEMKKGIITEWYHILEISCKAPFQKQNYYDLYGFSRDNEESGENGIDSGEEVLKMDVKDLKNDAIPELLFTVKTLNYKEKTSEKKLYVFKIKGSKFEKWNETKLIPK
ncbi:MAG: hypothetical protein HQM08_24450 [Candidatus Riflebacteria bacterium]|nr:hypothetical protein [Candidatus Riflebacteria bacterium]